jgi:hypothetical protein
VTVTRDRSVTVTLGSVSVTGDCDVTVTLGSLTVARDIATDRVTVTRDRHVNTLTLPRPLPALALRRHVALQLLAHVVARQLIHVVVVDAKVLALVDPRGILRVVRGQPLR